MSQLHEVLAVESDLEGVWKKILDEAKVTFDKRADHFLGSHKTLDYFKEIEGAPPVGIEEHKEMVTTVNDKLVYALDAFTRYLDVVLQKESTNQSARADLVVDGVTIATQVPAVFLLGLETKLKHVREMLDVTPTLAPGIAWEKDPTRGDNVYKRKNPEQKYKTAKTFQHKVLYEATDRHPAQIEKWEETVNVGMYVTNTWSGMLSPAEKSVLLGRCDKLIRAVKKARMKANQQEVVDAQIGKNIVDYILKG